MTSDPAITLDDNLRLIVTLAANWPVERVKTVIDRPNDATWPDQRVVTNFYAAGRIQLRIAAYPHVSAEYETFGKVDYDVAQYTTAGLRAESV